VKAARALVLASGLAALAVGPAACGENDDEGTTTETDAAAEDGGSAYIDETTGESAGLEPDTRRGTTPPPVETDDLERSASAAGCELRLDLPDEGNRHVPASRTPRYQSTPPTSGDHDATPLADGAYRDSPEPRFFVHSMEHGRVVIHYRPDLAEDDQLALKGVFEDDPGGMILIQNPDMPHAVAATAWRNAIVCDSYDEQVLSALRNFRDRFRGKGPERIPF
jgi:hypothetical protein